MIGLTKLFAKAYWDSNGIDGNNSGNSNISNYSHNSNNRNRENTSSNNRFKDSGVPFTLFKFHVLEFSTQHVQYIHISAPISALTQTTVPSMPAAGSRGACSTVGFRIWELRYVG